MLFRSVDGEVLYEVKPGTASGTRVRLKGKGMPSVRNAAQRGGGGFEAARSFILPFIPPLDKLSTGKFLLGDYKTVLQNIITGYWLFIRMGNTNITTSIIVLKKVVSRPEAVI